MEISERYSLGIECQKLLRTNAHLGRRVAAHHFKVYICGSRNGIAILDSDKTLICLRNALNFIGSPIRQKGRSFLLKTNQLLLYEIMEEMASCINYKREERWRIGAFLTNSCSSPKKIRSRKNQIHLGSNQQPDCVVILDADRKSSVILEADRSQIPIASLVDSTIPLRSYKIITYPIPANDPIQFVYLFRHSITKTVILEQNRIVAIQEKKENRVVYSSIGSSSNNERSLIEKKMIAGGLKIDKKIVVIGAPVEKQKIHIGSDFFSYYDCVNLVADLSAFSCICFFCPQVLRRICRLMADPRSNQVRLVFRKQRRVESKLQ